MFNPLSINKAYYTDAHMICKRFMHAIWALIEKLSISII
ncbi:hypothetical protein VCHA51O444_10145 [Vibrio chagasii]|nr:hypothetical protein VCHA51O444_10145 [Vibrio chagasii]